MSEKPGQVSGLGRRALLRNTLIAGAGAIALGAMSTTLAGAAEAAAGPGYQDNWGWCNQCNEIFWAGTNFEDAGVCPANDALYPHTLDGTKITNVAVVQQTNDGQESTQIDSFSIPKLTAETLTAQSARIDTVSGATSTSDGYIGSLQSALDMAGG
jgi:hypothetical protein